MLYEVITAYGFAFSDSAALGCRANPAKTIEVESCLVSGLLHGIVITSYSIHYTKLYDKKVEFAIGFGLGYKLDNGLNFSGRYNVGLSNILKSNGSILGEQITTDNSKNHNEVFQLSIGYFF